MGWPRTRRRRMIVPFPLTVTTEIALSGAIQLGCHSERSKPAKWQVAALLAMRFQTPYRISLLPISDFGLSRPRSHRAVTEKYQVPFSILATCRLSTPGLSICCMRSRLF
jgi:hypothetical protein